MKQLEVEISSANNNARCFQKLDGECFRSTHFKTMQDQIRQPQVKFISCQGRRSIELC